MPYAMCGMIRSRFYVLLTIVKVTYCLSPLLQAETWTSTSADRQKHQGESLL